MSFSREDPFLTPSSSARSVAFVTSAPGGGDKSSGQGQQDQSASDVGESPATTSSASAGVSLPLSPSAGERGTSRSTGSVPKAIRPPYPSTRIKGDVPKPWLEHKDPALRWAKIIYWSLIGLGTAGTAAMCFFGYRSVPTIGNLCLILDDDFSSGINPNTWSHEVRMDGFGNNEFEWTTTSSNNSFVRDNVLYLVPTLTADVIGADAVVNGHTVNLTIDGTCTSTNVSQCAATSNSSIKSIINPVQSARMNTKGKVSLRYGRVEVTARMPAGDWIWPAIWMLPENATYGVWPASGEIDIAESRGNSPSYPGRGLDYVQSTLHWGPITAFDQWYKTFGWGRDKINGYNSKFHKYAVEWDESYISLYIDNRAFATYETKFTQSFWKRGAFPSFFLNETGQVEPLINPWISSTNANAPFDQPFYLILDVAVGGTNGYFPDNVGGKPWSDSSSTAMSDFWAARSQWYPTWPSDTTKRGMAISSVKMWQRC